MDWYSGYYIRPWTRFPSFGIGIILGYILFKTKAKITISKVGTPPI
jgi:hypothetical protein